MALNPPDRSGDRKPFTQASDKVDWQSPWPVGNPLAPDSRTGRVAVRKVGQAPSEAVMRNLTDAEKLNTRRLR